MDEKLSELVDHLLWVTKDGKVHFYPEIKPKLESWCNVYLDKAGIRVDAVELDMGKCQQIVVSAINEAIENMRMEDEVKRYLKQLIHSLFTAIIEGDSKVGVKVDLICEKPYSAFEFQPETTQEPGILVETWRAWEKRLKERVKKELVQKGQRVYVKLKGTDLPSEFEEKVIDEIARDIVKEIEDEGADYEEMRRIIEKWFSSQQVEKEADKVNILNRVLPSIPEESQDSLKDFFLKKELRGKA